MRQSSVILNDKGNILGGLDVSIAIVDSLRF